MSQVVPVCLIAYHILLFPAFSSPPFHFKRIQGVFHLPTRRRFILRGHEAMSNNNQAEPPHRSIFDLPPNYFDLCRVYLHDKYSSSFTSLNSSETPNTAVNEESSKKVEEEEEQEEKKVTLSRWSCNTCKVEFESLQEQRAHFKSDFHRLNVKLTIVGKGSIREEDFDESASDSLFRDNDISSISGSEDEDERASHLSGDAYKKVRENDKQKVFICLHTGEIVSFWKCLLMDESENISLDNDKVVPEPNTRFFSYLRETELVERLKVLIHEPRDKSKLRIVLLASGGHFAGCVFDGNSVVAHKTFHRYVVRAKAGKKQSSKDASGKAASSAGASLRRYNEFALKKEIQDLLAAWKPYFDASSCVFISAPSNNRQLLFSAEKAYFSDSNCAVRHIPFTVRRPTFKEAKRIYNHLTNIVHEVVEEKPESTLDENPALVTSDVGNVILDSNEGKLGDNQTSEETTQVCHDIESSDRTESELIRTSTPLHEAAKSSNAEQIQELLEQGLDPCALDERGRTPYMLATDKEVRNMFRRFMALNLDKWDWHAAKVPSPLTKEMEESQAAKQAERDAKRKAKAKELKKIKKAKEKAQAQAQAELAQKAASISQNKRANGGPVIKTAQEVRLSMEEERKKAQAEEREKRAAAAEKRMAHGPGTSNTVVDDGMKCWYCNVSLVGKVPFHRYSYNYCTTTCMHLHAELLEYDAS